MLNWFASYLSDRKQGMVIEGVHSDWRNIEAGVLQGSVIGPLLHVFLIYINDLLSSVNSNCFLFADNCVLLEEVLSPSICASRLTYDLASISSWANRWLITMNGAKTKSMIFSSKRVKADHPPLLMNGVIIDDLAVHEHLGFTLSSNLSWSAHILKLHQKASKKLNLLKPLKYRLSCYSVEELYKSLVRSSLEYADMLCGMDAPTQMVVCWKVYRLRVLGLLQVL